MSVHRKSCGGSSCTLSSFSRPLSTPPCSIPTSATSKCLLALCMHVWLYCMVLDPDSRLRAELTFQDPEGFLCVYVGRISNEKRIHIIKEAIRPLDHVYLAIVGRISCVRVVH